MRKMEWIKLNMKFPGKCMECKKPIPAGQPGLWAKGVGVKHVSCASSKEASSSDAITAISNIVCSLCGKPAGCTECEFQDSCDIANVSPACLCYACSQKNNVMDLYYTCASGKKSSADTTTTTRSNNSGKNARLF